MIKKRWIGLFVENEIGVLALLEKCYVNRIEIVRGGNVAVEALTG